MIHVGDCLEVMRTLDANSVDAVICDPPYGLGFMGKAWDHGVPGEPFWREALRVAKPGAHLLAFGGTRTFHRLACAIEDAGWELRDTLMWVYGSGFPKSHNGPWGGTALKPAWEPIIMARKPLAGTVAANVQAHGTGALNIDGCRIKGEKGWPASESTFKGWQKDGDSVPTEPRGAGRWPANLIHDGSQEVVALFPKSDGQAAAVRGTEPSKTGDANCYGEFGRVPFSARGDTCSAARFFAQHQYSDEDWLWLNLSLAVSAGNSLCLQNESVASAVSRAATAALPAGSRCVVSTAPSTNVTATELKRIASELIETIQRTASACWHGQPRDARTQNASPARAVVAHGPTGTTTITVSHWKSDGSVDPVTFSITETNSEAGEKDSRFRYCAKADRQDRNDGCEGLPLKQSGMVSNTSGQHMTRRDGGAPLPAANNHPTVKPTDLMRWLCRLITPPGGLVLDPFTGSGSTGRGAIAEGMLFVGIELDPDYAAIAEARIRAIQPGLSLAGVA